MHQPYDQRVKHPPDFRVTYRFYSEAEGGRQNLPFQGYRSDFWYYHQDHAPNNIFMIWPEFEEENGDLIIQSDTPVSLSGIARMWIINPVTRAYHQSKIHVGLTGWFMEGSRRVAECTVIEIVGLNENPTE